MSRSAEFERGLQAFAWALALVALMSIAFPLADLVLNNLPADVSRTEWRYQFSGTLSQAVMSPVLGLLLLVAASLAGSWASIARLSGLLAFAGAIAMLGLTALFVIDGLEARNLVPPEAMSVFTVNSIRAVVKNTFSIGTLGIIGWAAFRIAGSMQPREDRTKDKSALYGT